MDLANLTVESFRAVIGETFRVDSENEPQLHLVLSEVQALVAPPGAPREPFSLLFTGPRDPMLSQGIWHMDHATIGLTGIFLVPIGRDEAGTTYQAVFS